MFRNKLAAWASILVLTALSALAGLAVAQPTPAPGVSQSGSVAAGDCTKWIGTLLIGDAGSACGGGAGSPGGSNGQIQYNNTGAFGGFTMAGDCTFAVPNVTCLKTNGTSFGTFATQNYATPPAIGGTTPAGGFFTTLSASSTVSGTGFSTYLASPPAIGATLANTGNFSSLTDTGVTGSTQCVQVNSSGTLQGTGNVCGSGSGTITSISTNNGLTGGGSSGAVTLGLATIAANSDLANTTGSTAVPTASTIPSCSGASSAIIYTSGTGWGCHTVSDGTTGATYDNATAYTPTLTAGGPTGFKMLGLGGVALGSYSITPARSGTVVFTISGFITFLGNVQDVVNMELYYGTGTAPTNGHAVTGTQCSGTMEAEAPVATTNTTTIPFTLSCLVAGLSLSTAYWFDISEANANGSFTTGLTTSSALAFETP